MNPKTYLISIFVVLILVGGVLMTRDQFFLQKRNPSTNNMLADSSFGWKIPTIIFTTSGQVSDSGAYSKLRSQGKVPSGLPVRLKIPVIGVDTAIEDAYVTSDGRMDVPAGSENVAWFALGPHPGQTGSAVIGGHYGIDNGVPKVFYNLSKLKVGDKAYVVDDSNNTLAFAVRSIKLFDRNAESSSVFLSNDGLAHLNIITCEGVWNKVNDSYPDRRVVFTDAIPSEGSVTVTKAKPTIAAKPALPQTAETVASPTMTTSDVATESASSFSTFVGNIISAIISIFKPVGQ